MLNLYFCVLEHSRSGRYPTNPQKIYKRADSPASAHSLASANHLASDEPGSTGNHISDNPADVTDARSKEFVKQVSNWQGKDPGKKVYRQISQAFMRFLTIISDWNELSVLYIIHTAVQSVNVVIKEKKKKGLGAGGKLRLKCGYRIMRYSSCTKNWG